MSNTTRVINNISDPFDRYPFLVEVDFYEEDPQGNRDGFQTERIALPWTIWDTDDEAEQKKRIEKYVCNELHAEIQL